MNSVRTELAEEEKNSFFGRDKERTQGEKNKMKYITKKYSSIGLCVGRRTITFLNRSTAHEIHYWHEN